MIPRTIFSAEHDQFRESVRRFLVAEAVPHYEAWEAQGFIDRELWRKAGEQGILVPTAPEEYGGVGANYLYNAIVTEELSRLGLVSVGFTVHSDIVVPYILHNGTEAQKKKYIPGCLSGNIVTAIAMTEPGAGSDLQGLRTTALDKGDHYVLNGAKTFISNGQQADLVVVVCRTNPDPAAGSRAFSLLILERDTEGFERGRNLDKLGMKAQDTSELFFQDVRVPKENILGEEGGGFRYLMQELPQERLSIAIGALANSEYLLSTTVNYVKERRAFGQSLAEFQNTQFKLADLDAKVSCMRAFIDRCIELHVEGKLDAVTASKAKLLASELQGKVADECLQLHGGYGYMMEYPIARGYADARIQRIHGGTSEVMKLIIARALLSD